MADRISLVARSLAKLVANPWAAFHHRPGSGAVARLHEGLRLLYLVLRSGLLAHRENCPELRWPRSDSDRKQDSSPGRRSNQGATDKGAHSTSRYGVSGAAPACAARALSKAVNLWAN